MKPEESTFCLNSFRDGSGEFASIIRRDDRTPVLEFADPRQEPRLRFTNEFYARLFLHSQDILDTLCDLLRAESSRTRVARKAQRLVDTVISGGPAPSEEHTVELKVMNPDALLRAIDFYGEADSDIDAAGISEVRINGELTRP